MDRDEVIKVAHSMLPKKAELLYLVEFGSRLYGTDTPDSDYDYLGLYLPGINDLVCMRNSKSCQFSTGNDKSKNTKDDFDIQVWSLQYWLLDLVRKMDTVALDLFFSPSNEQAVLFKSDIIDSTYRLPNHFIESAQVSNSAYIRYAMSQARRYGIKGTKLNLLMELENYLEDFASKFDKKFLRESRLDMIADAILAKFEGNEYLSTRQLKGEHDALQICGKFYPYYITLDYFIQSITAATESYGKRAQMAARNEGIDWKAISHAMRAIYQAQQLAETGVIKFPLDMATRYDLIAIKTGQVTWADVSAKLEEGIQAIDKLEPSWVGHYDVKLAEALIRSMYEL